MTDAIAAILEGIGSALATLHDQDRGWGYVLGYFALIAAILAGLVLLIIYR